MGVDGHCHALATLPRGKTRYPSYRRPGRPQGQSGQVRKISPPTYCGSHVPELVWVLQLIEKSLASTGNLIVCFWSHELRLTCNWSALCPAPLFSLPLDTNMTFEHSGLLLQWWDQDSVVSIVTCYRLEDLGIESWWGRDILHLSRPALGPTQPPVHWYWVSCLGVKQLGSIEEEIQH